MGKRLFFVSMDGIVDPDILKRHQDCLEAAIKATGLDAVVVMMDRNARLQELDPCPEPQLPGMGEQPKPPAPAKRK